MVARVPMAADFATSSIVGTPALPHAGAGTAVGSASMNVFLVGSLVAVALAGGAALIRIITGRRLELEDDGITIVS